MTDNQDEKTEIVELLKQINNRLKTVQAFCYIMYVVAGILIAFILAR